MKYLTIKIILLFVFLPKNFVMDKYKEINLSELKFTQQRGFKVYFDECDDIIELREGNMLVKSFTNYSDFSQYIVDQKLVDIEQVKEMNKGIGQFQGYILHSEFLFNKERIQFGVDSTFFINKFIELFCLDNISGLDLSEENINVINSKLSQIYLGGNKNEISKYIIPSVVFIGEYYRRKYCLEWTYLEASNIINQNMIIPEIEIEQLSLKIAYRVIRDLHHPKYFSFDSEPDFGKYFYWDYNIGKSKINVKKQTPFN